tara:strand:+ start:338 stop:967 length:630 start_codon:yes stop_codon:yes gene_type:complete
LSKILKKIKSRILYVSPKRVKYCIYPTKFCDYNQFELSRIHPHAGVNRGVFDENPNGYVKINATDWDKKPGIMFMKLLEFIALEDHYTGKNNWKKSKFAKRNVNYIKSNNSVRGFTDYKDYLLTRERQIDDLFDSIIKKGIYPNDTSKKKKKDNDNISVVLTKSDQLYFNNRGHHRLSIAQILKLKEIPITIVTAKSKKALEKFHLSNK